MTLPIDAARAAWTAALDAADPAACVAAAALRLPALPDRVIAIGKAAAAMWRGFTATLAPHRATPPAIVLTPYGHSGPLDDATVFEARHPIPDAAGLAAAHRIADGARALDANQSLLVLLSGGGSALLAAPLPAIEFADYEAASRALIASGAPIAEINCVRRHLLALGGGRLAALCAGRVATFALSDVPGDALADIASGPTVADPTTFAEALAVLSRAAIALPDPIDAFLRSGVAGGQPETLKPGDPRLARSTATLVGSATASLDAAAAELTRRGYTVRNAGGAISAEATTLARQMAAEIVAWRRAGATRTAWLSGGEAQVRIGAAGGAGGRNTTFLLALWAALDGAASLDGITALAADTDGIDGTGPHAGAWFATGDRARAARLGLAPRPALDAHDSYRFFSALDRALVTGPTGTNVNDFRVVLLE